jgi:hypothetical protein
LNDFQTKKVEIIREPNSLRLYKLGSNPPGVIAGHQSLTALFFAETVIVTLDSPAVTLTDFDTVPTVQSPEIERIPDVATGAIR